MAARSAHNAEVIGSSPVPARDTFNQPPRGVSWVMLMIKNFWFFLNKVAKNNGIDLLNKAQEKSKELLSKEVEQYTKDMIFIQKFSSAADAARWLYENKMIPTLSSGVRGHIAEVCNGKRKTAYKYIWKYSAE